MTLTQEEHALIVSCQKQEKKSVKKLLKLHVEPLYGLMYHLCEGRAVNAQNILIHAAATLVSETPSEISGPNLKVRILRHALELLPGIFKTQRNIATMHLSGLRMKWIYEAVMGLVWKERLILFLRDLAEWSLEDIGEAVHMSEEQVRHELRLAWMHFRQAVDERLRQQRQRQ